VGCFNTKRILNKKEKYGMIKSSVRKSVILFLGEMIMKNFISIILITIQLLCMVTVVQAEEDIRIEFTAKENEKIYISGECVGEVMMKEGTTLVPVRVISETLGAVVEWKEDTEEVVVSKENSIITMQIGNKIADVNGEKIEMLQAPVLKDDRTRVPFRFIAESFGLTVDYDEVTANVEMYKEPENAVITDKGDKVNYKNKYISFDILKSDYENRSPFFSYNYDDKEIQLQMEKFSVLVGIFEIKNSESMWWMRNQEVLSAQEAMEIEEYINNRNEITEKNEKYFADGTKYYWMAIKYQNFGREQYGVYVYFENNNVLYCMRVFGDGDYEEFTSKAFDVINSVKIEKDILGKGFAKLDEEKEVQCSNEYFSTSYNNRYWNGECVDSNLNFNGVTAKVYLQVYNDRVYYDGFAEDLIKYIEYGWEVPANLNGELKYETLTIDGLEFVKYDGSAAHTFYFKEYNNKLILLYAESSNLSSYAKDSDEFNDALEIIANADIDFEAIAKLEAESDEVAVAEFNEALPINKVWVDR